MWPRVRWLRAAMLAMVLALIVQFLSGIALNPFVTITHDHPGFKPAEYFTGVAQSVTWAVGQGPVLLEFHAGLGLLLVAASLSVLIRSIAAGRRFAVPNAFGFVAIVAAGFNGGSFLNYDEDVSSMIMAAFFAIAVASYVVGLYIATASDSGPRTSR